MGYKNNQFHGFPLFGGEEQYYNSRLERVGKSGYESTSDNPPFQYPSRTVRTNDHNGYQATNLRRGYMRSLRTQADGIEVEVKKCQFQFNPSVLEQSVTQAEGLLNVFQSDPAQYAQPMPGNVAFGFTLMFDRTMEMNNSGNRLSEALGGSVIDVENPWEKSEPGEVGVLRDLATLYSVIGQGISSYQREYLQALLEKQASREVEVLKKDGDTEAEAGYQEVVAKGIPGFLDMNVGNTAFLLPVPIRIVFSSLYIVEGYAASTSVVFTKFNTAMVPIQCAVTINVDAKYIGFAQRNTFLTQSLALEVQNYEATQQQIADDANNVSNIMSIAASYLSVYASGWDTTGPLRIWEVWQLPDPDAKFEMVTKGPPAGFQEAPAVANAWNGTFTSAVVNSNIELFGPYSTNPGTGSAELKPKATPDLSKGVLNMVQDAESENMQASTYPEYKKLMEQAHGGPIPAPSTLITTSNTFYIVKYAASLRVNGVRGYGEKYQVVTDSTYNDYLLDATVTIAWPQVTAQSTSGASVAPDNGASSLSTTAPGASSRVTGPRI